MFFRRRRFYGLRHKWEVVVLLLTFLPFALSFGLFATSSLGTTVLTFGVALVWLVMRLRARRAQLMGSGVRVSATQLPDVWESYRRCEAVAPLGVTLFVVQSAELQAYTFGFGRGAVVVLTSKLVDDLTADELTAVMAHEWGHLLLGHTWLLSLFGMLNQAMPELMGLSVPKKSPRGDLTSLATTFALLFAPLMLLGYRRLAEFSADRFAVLVLGEADTPRLALSKVAVGPDLAAQLNQAELMNQVLELERSWLGKIQRAFGTHPFIGKRLAAMKGWEESAEFRRLREVRRVGACEEVMG